ncbi:MAG: hypothetical protein HKP41_08930 [Desulfobacterales bacterium]|nr:hypothetical protein [Desulfobacterales bacterium]
MNQLPSILFLVSSPLPARLLRIFQKGAQVEVELGSDLLTLLTSELRLSKQGIEKIQTIFWQGKPVDDLAQCVTTENGELALSAALPGLVGACLRRGGVWSALRDSISHQGKRISERGKRGLITIKLFNFMLQEVGPLLLNRGVIVTKDAFVELCNSTLLWDQVIRVSSEEKQLTKDEMREFLNKTDINHFKLLVSQTPE